MFGTLQKDNMTVIGTGLNGLIGSKLVQMYSEKYSFLNIDRLDQTNPIDITVLDQVTEFMSTSKADYVVHFAAFTDVTKAWEQRNDRHGSAFQVNVVGTRNIVTAANLTHKHVIHVSTAYVFDGRNEGLYTELDRVHPIEWYGETKSLAEEEVTKNAQKWTILRIDQPFRSDPFVKVDLAHRILTGLQHDTLFPQFSDHFIGPTFIDDFVKVIDWVIRTGASGLFHASSGEKWSDFELAKLINESQQSRIIVKEGYLAEYLKTLHRPYQKNTALDCSKLKAALDFPLTSIKDAVKLLTI